jgi:hypothetical protein
MAKLRVTKVDGSVTEYEITPLLEWSFEQYANKGFHKAILEDQKQSNIYWLCFEAARRAGEMPKPFGEGFLQTLKSVEVLESDPLA